MTIEYSTVPFPDMPQLSRRDPFYEDGALAIKSDKPFKSYSRIKHQHHATAPILRAGFEVDGLTSQA